MYGKNYKNHPKDWLAAVEILEISSDDSLNAEIKRHLKMRMVMKSLKV